jgi:hypothetical protein
MNDKEKKWSDSLDSTASNISKELNSDEYKFYSETDGCKVYQKQTTPTVRWKSICDFDFPAKKIMETFITEDLDKKRNFDTEVAEKYNFKVFFQFFNIFEDC